MNGLFTKYPQAYSPISIFCSFKAIVLLLPVSIFSAPRKYFRRFMAKNNNICIPISHQFMLTNSLPKMNECNIGLNNQQYFLEFVLYESHNNIWNKSNLIQNKFTNSEINLSRTNISNHANLWVVPMPEASPKPPRPESHSVRVYKQTRHK